MRKGLAGGFQGDTARGGVEDDAMDGGDGDSGNLVSQQKHSSSDSSNQQQHGSKSSRGRNLQQQQQQQVGEEEEMIGNVNDEDQVIYITEWDFSEVEVMKRAIKAVEDRQGKVIDLSRLARALLSHVNKVIECAKEPDKRDLLG